VSTHDDRVTDIWAALSDLVLQDDRRRRVADELGISFFRTKVLRRLIPGPASMRDLAVRLGTDKAYLSVVVDDLEERGLLERSVDSEDRRVRLLTLTSTGLSTARRAHQLLAQAPVGLQGLSDTDLSRLEKILEKIRA
jgi:DNA-binding MarR family transcriptional regulator